MGRNAKVVELISPLPVDECCWQLRVMMDRPYTFPGTRPVIGRLNGNKLRAWRRIRYRNSFQTELSAELIAREGGTLIRCRFSMNPFVRAFIFVWLGIVGLVCVWLVVIRWLPLTPPVAPAHAQPTAAIAVPILMFLAGLSLLGVGRFLAREERPFLIDFVDQTLKAKPV